MKELRAISITGYFSPFYLDNQPILASIGGVGQMILVFSTVEKLREGMGKFFPGQEYRIKHIDDGTEFTDSIFEYRIRVALDPRIVEGCKTRWTEIVRNGPNFN
jgi:hypothetical protein